MNAREIEKIVDVEGRRFFVRKYDVFTGVMMAKLFTAKILPIFQAFIPMLSDFLRTGELRDGSSEEGLSLDSVTAKILNHLQDFLNLEGIARALDLVEESDLRYIMSASFTHCFEDLSAGRTQVMRKDGT